MSSDFYCPKVGAGKCVGTGRASFCCALCFCAGFLVSYIVAGKDEVKCCPMAPVAQPQKVDITVTVVAPKEIQINAKSNVNVEGCVGVNGKVCVDSHISGGVDVCGKISCECNRLCEKEYCAAMCRWQEAMKQWEKCRTQCK